MFGGRAFPQGDEVAGIAAQDMPELGEERFGRDLGSLEAATATTSPSSSRCSKPRSPGTTVGAAPGPAALAPHGWHCFKQR